MLATHLRKLWTCFTASITLFSLVRETTGRMLLMVRALTQSSYVGLVEDGGLRDGCPAQHLGLTAVTPFPPGGLGWTVSVTVGDGSLRSQGRVMQIGPADPRNSEPPRRGEVCCPSISCIYPSNALGCYERKIELTDRIYYLKFTYKLKCLLLPARPTQGQWSFVKAGKA